MSLLKTSHPDSEHKYQNPLITPFEYVVYSQRWVLMLMYAVFSIAVDSYVLHACWEMLHLVPEIWHQDSHKTLQDMFEHLDELMIGSAFYLITGGSMIVFVKKWINSAIFKNEEDRPDAFFHLTPTSLKERMLSSVVGVSAVLIIGLMVETVSSELALADKVYLSLAIHIVLVVSLMAYAHISHKEKGH